MKNFRRFGALGFWLILSSPAAAASGPRVDMSAQPSVGPVKAYAPPPRVEFKLSNGLEVLLVEDHRYPLVSARLAVRRGGSALGAEEAGVMEALTELLTEGTAKMTAKQIAEAADAIGGEIGVGAGRDFSALQAYALSEHADKLLDLMWEVALQPAFPNDEVALRKRNMLEELKVSRSQASFLSSLAFNKKLYGSHPYAVTSPTEKSIAGISRGRLVELHKRYFAPNIAVLILVGDIDVPGVKEAIQKRFGAWAQVEVPIHAGESPPQKPKRRVYLFDRPGSAQTDIRLGNLALREKDPDYFPLLVLNGVLGGTFASRLVTDIREKRGYAYDIGTWIAPQRDLGAFTLGTQVRTAVTGEALKAILDIFNGIRKDGVSEEELSQAKNALAGRFVRQMETQEGVADQFLHDKLYDLPQDYLETYVGNIQKVTREQALRAAKTHILPDNLVIAAVGDGAKIEQSLSSFSAEPLQKVDENGD